MSDLIKYRLGDQCRVINGRAYKQEELLESGKYRVLRVGNFFSNGSWYYSDLDLEDDKYCIQGDLLFAWSASFGPKIWKEDRTIFHYHIWKLEENALTLNKVFLYYYLKNITQSMLGSTHGSIMLHLTKAYMEDLVISVPKNVKIQQKIALVLSSLDSKIELNNRINAELEAMAKLIYDYWFVQFDFPDKNGKPYKSSGGKMVWNEELKREIPEGWKVEGIEKSCSIIDCLHSKKSDYTYEDDQSFLLQLENIKDDGLIDLSKKYYVTREEYKKWTSRIEVKENDIVITNAGRVAATAQISKGIVSGIGRNITAIRPNTINPTFLFLSFRGVDIKRQIKLNTDSGAFFTSFNVKGIKKLMLLRPPLVIENSFEKLIYSNRRLRELNSAENLQLTELRDWLLPMLMNGQVKVKD